jgi:hypothetical protein
LSKNPGDKNFIFRLVSRIPEMPASFFVKPGFARHLLYGCQVSSLRFKVSHAGHIATLNLKPETSHNKTIREEEITMNRKAFWFFRSVFVLSAMLALSLEHVQAQAGFIVYYVDEFGSEDASNIFQDTDGNIGIGTKTPAAKLDVVGGM